MDLRIIKERGHFGRVFGLYAWNVHRLCMVCVSGFGLIPGFLTMLPYPAVLLGVFHLI